MSAKTTQPFTFRLPKSGTVDPWWSFNRSGWNTLVLPNAGNKFRPPVKSIVIKQDGAKRGRRFIIFDSAKAYFEKLQREQSAKGEK